MAIQNDNTLVTKGDLKELYTDKIAPYLGGGISYYQCDRTGEELRTTKMLLNEDESIPVHVYTDPPLKVNNFVTSYNGSHPFETGSGTVKVPEGCRVEIFGSLMAHGSSGTVDCDYVIRDFTAGVNLAVGVMNYIGGGYSWGGPAATYYTAPAGGAEIGMAIAKSNTSLKLSSGRCFFMVQEIGRIVDPVKYVSNNSDLQETPVGNIISYMGNTVPKHYLACDGTEYNIGTYPELEAFIIDEFGSINYFGGDGTSKWAVPDLRGEFLRGTGTNSHENQGNGANVGIHQDATEHRNLMSGPKSWTNIYFENADGDHAGAVNPDSNTQHRDASNSAKVDFSSISGDYSTTHYTARPTNTSVKYCIKYESTFHAFFSNAAYKVSVAASVTAHSGAAIAITLDNSDIIGDASLVSGNSFIAPLDGFYLIGMNWSNNGVWEQNYMINVNGTDVYHVVGIGVTDMLQLQKDDVVTIKTSKTSAQSGRVSFALVTSNYNPTIVSADSVYSENEQMIGYWKNGKPLYQKTVHTGALSNAGTSDWVQTTSIAIGASVDEFICSYGILYSTNKEWCAPIPYSVNNDIFVVPSLFPNTAPSNSNTVCVAYLGNLGWVTDSYITIQYTKTTDTASTLQVENSLLLNRPDLWTAGTEYHFGGGLYGKRIVSSTSQTIASNGQLDVLIATGVSQIINSGGSFKEPSQQYGVQIPSSYYNDGWSTGFWYNSYNSTQDLYYWFKNDSENGSRIITYDVWVLYKK